MSIGTLHSIQCLQIINIHIESLKLGWSTCVCMFISCNGLNNEANVIKYWYMIHDTLCPDTLHCRAMVVLLSLSSRPLLQAWH